eukprot:TRINITY_DN954_c0_g1_i4.p1 TRINITY_DN954_c0_g1~~TRINITY_DN954_c0_g1_i4.p1  ORF type:complete len:191 (+),score=12.56 TRINITY_DN954_c0_g1_i4:24-596(+)
MNKLPKLLHPWLGKRVPTGFWSVKENQKSFVEWLSRELNIASDEDWYSVKSKDVRKMKGAGLIKNHYRGSLYEMLKSVYPDKSWIEWKFCYVSRGFWDNLDNRMEYLKWFQDKLNITDPEHWYAIGIKHFYQNHGATLIVRYRGSIYLLLKEHRPSDYEWYRVSRKQIQKLGAAVRVIALPPYSIFHHGR